MHITHCDSMNKGLASETKWSVGSNYCVSTFYIGAGGL